MGKHLLTYIFILTFTKLTSSQTANTGLVYITPNTQVSFASDFNNTSTGELWNNGKIYATGNWNNAGIIDFSIFNLNEGDINFIGNNIQIISGTQFNYFYNVLFDNPSDLLAIDLQGKISISNEANFRQGIINNKFSDGLLIFEQDSKHIGAKNKCHVNGNIIKIGDNSFEYPVGNGVHFRAAGISSPSSGNAAFSGEYFFEDTNTKYPINNLGPNLILIDNTEHWIIKDLNGGSQVYITLTWNNETTPIEILNAPKESIHIARWDESLSMWIDQGGILNIKNQSVSSLVQNYGTVTLAKCK